MSKTISKIRAFPIALFLFLTLNFFFAYLDLRHPFSKLALDNQHFDFSGTEAGVDKLNPPQTLLVGSSLMLYPAWRADQQQGAENFDSNHYHFARSLNSNLRQRGLEGGVYNLAVGGSMMSDSYLALNRYLRKHPAPKYVVLDCAPRGFYDGGEITPSLTPFFDYLFDAEDFVQLNKVYLRSTESKLNFLISRASFFFHHRRCLAEIAFHAPEWASWNKLAAVFQKYCDPSPVVPAAQVTQETQATEAIEAHATLAMPAMPTTHATPAMPTMPATPITQTTQDQKVKDLAAREDSPLRLKYSVDDYKKRYFLVNLYQMQQQFEFLKLFVQRCKAGNIKLIVANMPLSEANKKLLPSGLYDDFKNQLKTITTGNATYLDLDQWDNWVQSDYSDSVHLNNVGARKLNSRLAQQISKLAADKDASIRYQ